MAPHKGGHGGKLGKFLHQIGKAFGVHSRRHREHHGQQGKHNEMRQRMRADLASKCAEDLAENTNCQEEKCPRKQIRCLAELSDSLSPVCSEFVIATTTAMRERHGGKGHHGGKSDEGEMSDEDNFMRDEGEDEFQFGWGMEDGHETTDADENGCYQKEDGLWCPNEDGTWMRDDGLIYEPRAFCMFRLLRLLGWGIAALLLAIGLLWGFFERKRRRTEGAERPPRVGSYFSTLCECFTRPRICFPACLFTPVLAAFNRAEADERECNACDVCFALAKPISQYTTRQTIRGKYNMQDDNIRDCCTAVCCTPCAVAQDTLELEKRTAVQAPAPTPMGAPGLPVYVVAAATPPSDIAMDKIDKGDEQV